MGKCVVYFERPNMKVDKSTTPILMLLHISLYLFKVSAQTKAPKVNPEIWDSSGLQIIRRGCVRQSANFFFYLD